MIFVSNFPALPTKGSPNSSSSAPGASPTNINCASMLPTPNTTFLRDTARCGHFTHASARSRSAAKAVDLSIADCRLPVAGCSAAGEIVFGAGKLFCVGTFVSALAGGAPAEFFSTGNRKSEIGNFPGDCASARKVSGATATCRTPRAFKPSTCWMVASSNCR